MNVATGGGLCSTKRIAIQELTCFIILGKRFVKYFKQGNSHSYGITLNVGETFFQKKTPLNYILYIKFKTLFKC